MNTSIGHVSDAADLRMLGIDSVPGGGADLPEDASDGGLLWEYRYEGKINGIRVADRDRSLPIDKDADIMAAFELVRVPRSELLVVSPDSPDGLKRYNEILEMAYAGAATVLDETRQFDSAKGGFIVWIRYDELSYALDSRHAYLREENAI